MTKSAAPSGDTAGRQGNAPVPVVAAVIEIGGRFLLTRRLAGVHLGGMWEFPGGKIEPGETPAAALQREIREELDTDADVGQLLLETTHFYPEHTVRLSFFDCRLRGEPRAALGQEMRWVERNELAHLGLPDADVALIRLLAGSDARLPSR